QTELDRLRLALSTTRNLRSWGGTAGNPEELVTTRRRHCARRSGSARLGQRSRESRESRSGWQQHRTSNDSSRPAIPMVSSASRRKHRERGAKDLTLGFPSHHRQCTLFHHPRIHCQLPLHTAAYGAQKAHLDGLPYLPETEGPQEKNHSISPLHIPATAPHDRENDKLGTTPVRPPQSTSLPSTLHE